MLTNFSTLNAKFREKLESIFLSTEGTSKENRKKSHAEFQEQMKVLYNNIYLMDLGTAEFEGIGAPFISLNMMFSLLF